MTNDPFRDLTPASARAVRLALALARVQQERDTLKAQLDHYERHCTCPAHAPILEPAKTDD